METVSRHVARCQGCASELALVRVAGNAFRDAKSPAKEPAGNLWERIEEKITATTRPAPAWHVRSLQVAGTAAAAAVILLAVVNVSKIGDMLDRGKPVVSSPPPPIVLPEHGTRPSSGATTRVGTIPDHPGAPSESAGGHKMPAMIPDGNAGKLEPPRRYSITADSPRGELAMAVASDKKDERVPAASSVSEPVSSAVPGPVIEGAVLGTTGPRGSAGPAGPAGRDTRIAEGKEDSSFNEESGAVFYNDRAEIASKPFDTGYSFRSITEDSTGVDAAGAFELKLEYSDTTETSVDLLNDADTEARYMALFRYP